MINYREIRLIIFACQHSFSNSEANAHGEAVTQGASGNIHAGSQAIFRMAGSLASPLTEVLQLLQGQVIASQMQHSI